MHMIMIHLHPLIVLAAFTPLQLKQDIGFYDTSKSGEISSRLSADTTKVSDQIGLNFNIMLRSFVQAAGVLVFMFWLRYVA